MHGKWIEISILGFVSGVALRSFSLIDFKIALLLFSVSLVATVFGIAKSKYRILLYVGITISAAVAGIARYEISEPRQSFLAPFVNTSILAEGIIIKEPDEREQTTLYTVEVDTVVSQTGNVETSEKLLIVANAFPKFNYADRIRINGLLQEPQNFTSKSGRLFDYRSYLAKEGIHFQIFRPKVEKLGEGYASKTISLLLSAKKAFLHSINQYVPEPESSLLAGILLGEKRGLGEALSEQFRRAGLVHIVVLSGYNMTIVAYFLMWMFSALPRIVSPIAGAVGIVLFTVVVGGGATAVRAAIMALLIILARVTRRDYDIRRALFLAGFAMIAHNPKILAFDPSFQLSFLATIGIIYLSPRLEKKLLSFLTEKFGIKNIISATIATSLSVLPLILFLSGEVSIVSVVANLLVLPLIPLTMLSGLCLGLGAFASEAIAFVLTPIAYGLLHYIILVGSFFGSLPFAVLTLPF